jgi:hypothetical protein
MDQVEAQQWRKSKRCSSSACIEVAKVAGDYLIRDSKDPDGSVLTFSEQEWTAFVEGVADGEFRF